MCRFQGALGTNPISMAARATGGDSILVDMSSTAVAMGKVSEIDNNNCGKGSNFFEFEFG